MDPGLEPEPGNPSNHMDRDVMSNSVITPSVGTPHWEPKFPFDLVVAYEDSETRNRALHLYDHLAQQLLDDYDFQCAWWKFEHLADTRLGQQAADSATSANMIILCLHTRSELPAVVQKWIEDWLPRRDNRKAALVALLGGPEEARESAEPMLTYLRRVARTGHMDFFDHAFDLSLPTRRVSVPSMPEPPRIPVVSAPAAVVPSSLPSAQRMHHQVPTPRWGINE